MKVTIELSKNNNLVTRLKVQGGQYYYDLKKIEDLMLELKLKDLAK